MCIEYNVFSLDDHEEATEKELLTEKPADEGKPKSDITIMYLCIICIYTHLTFFQY